MDASLQARAEQLAKEIAGEARTAEDLNGLMRLMMKSALEQMLDTEMDVHLGRKTTGGADAEPAASEAPSDEAKTGKKNRRNGARPQNGAQRDGRLDDFHPARPQQHV